MRSPTEHRPSVHTRLAGFSLVEVALAIAVVSVALVSILSLMSTGLGNYRKVMDTTICSQIAQRIVSDAQQTDFKVLTDDANVTPKEKADPNFSFRAPSKANPAFRYFNEQGNEIIPKAEGKLSAKEYLAVAYVVNTRIIPRALMPRTDGKTTGGEMAQVTVEIACNPSGVEMSVEKSGDRENLLKNKNNMTIFTYSALVGRNE